MAAPEISPINRRPELEGIVQAEIDVATGRFAAIAIDLDDLKEVNESEGHDNGDKYIKTARDVLQALIGQPDDQDDEVRQAGTIIEGRAVHLAGDEYWVVLYGVKTQAQVDAFIARMKAVLDDYGIGASMGGRVHRPGEEVEDMLANADDMLYEDKMQRVLDKHRLSILEEALLLEHALAIRRILGEVSLRTVQKYFDAMKWRDDGMHDRRRPRPLLPI